MGKIKLPKQFPTNMTDWYKLIRQSLESIGVQQPGNAYVRYYYRTTHITGIGDPMPKSVDPRWLNSCAFWKDSEHISTTIDEMLEKLRITPWRFACYSPPTQNGKIVIERFWHDKTVAEAKYNKERMHTPLAKLVLKQAPNNCGASVLTNMWVDPAYREHNLARLLTNFFEYIAVFYGNFSMLMATTIYKHEGWMGTKDIERMNHILEKMKWEQATHWNNPNSNNTLCLWFKHPDNLDELRKLYNDEEFMWTEAEEGDLAYDADFEEEDY